MALMVKVYGTPTVASGKELVVIWMGTTDVSDEWPSTPSRVAEIVLAPSVVSSAVVIKALIHVPTAELGKTHRDSGAPMVATEVLELAHVASCVTLMNCVK